MYRRQKAEKFSAKTRKEAAIINLDINLSLMYVWSALV